MAGTRCEKTDLPVEMCSHCRGLDTPEVPKYTVAFSMPAKWDGLGACGHRTYQGDTIHKTDEGQWICGPCGGRS